MHPVASEETEKENYDLCTICSPTIMAVTCTEIYIVLLNCNIQYVMFDYLLTQQIHLSANPYL